MITNQHRRAGLGDAEKAQYTQAATVVATSAVGTAASAGLIGASVAGPIGLALVGAGLLFTLMFSRKGPQQKVQSSQDVDSYEPYFAANVASYQAGQVSKADALNTFDTLWAQLVQDLSNPALGEPGQRAIQERGREGRPGWGANWFELYRDPIANAPDSTGGLLPTSVTNIVGEGNGWILPVGLIALVVLWKL